MDLEEENKKLKESIAIKSEIFSIGTHQIRTSLAAIKWILKMFLDGDLGKISSEQENLLRKALDGNERAINTVSELLLINKSEDVVEKEYIFEDVDLVELVDNCVFDFSGESIARGIEIIFLKQNNLPKIKADKEKMRVVFQNLIENSIKYSNYHGKVFISIKKLEKEKFLEISIKDSGIGIPDNQKDKIFEKFFRTDVAQKKEAMGSGIGLYTTKKIVECHGGKIWFENKDNQGVTFIFTVPTV